MQSLSKPFSFGKWSEIFVLQQESNWVSVAELFYATSTLNRFEAYRALVVRHWLWWGMFARLYSTGVKLRGGKKPPFLCILKGRILNAVFRLLIIAKMSLKIENMRHYTTLNPCSFTKTSSCTVLQRSRELGRSFSHNHVSIFSLFMDSYIYFCRNR